MDNMNNGPHQLLQKKSYHQNQSQEIVTIKDF